MSQIQISTLHKISTFLSRIAELEDIISNIREKNESLKLRNREESESFSVKTEDELILKTNMELFALSQDKIKSDEIAAKQKIAQEIEVLIHSFFEGDNLKTLIQKIIKANDGIKYTIEADPAIAKSLKLEDTIPSNEGVLNVVFDHKKYILNKLSLSNSLRKILLVKAFN